MITHTIGRWIAEEDHIHRWSIRQEDKRKHFALVYGETMHIPTVLDCDVEIYRQVAEKARLMAAAPELLEALDMIHKSFGGGNVITFSEADIAQIGAAIAKATGTA